jgi:tetratricopeptide (TPR) repeat protein
VSSIIEGYSYDVFINYRQKDNKHDGWVTEFVNNLKGELESTFKEEISVYFDINTHDGLLETHDVEASLHDKLKCLIFIPIISRTYCDPKSFAWEHEFKVFIELASHDQFGLKVKLPNGNVAGRVLPVRIHDLDNTDIKLCESVLGSVLRGIEFIYKESGIDKPLSPEDDEKKNLNKTKYRIQIIKVTHSIKEIILGMKVQLVQIVQEKEHTKKLVTEVREDEGKIDQKIFIKSGQGKFIPLFAFISLLLIITIFIYPGFFKRNTLEKLRSSGERISVAIMPFQNLTNDTIWDVWQDGIQNNLITSLTNFSEELKVRQTESITSVLQSKGLTSYASITPSVARKVSQKLDADVFVYGSINESGLTIRLNAQLVDSKTEDAIKSFQINGIADNILPLIDTLSREIKDFLLISKLKKESSNDYKDVSTTTSPEAFRYFIYGRNEIIRYNYLSARNWLNQAIAIDSSFLDAIIMLSNSYLDEIEYEQNTNSPVNEFLYNQAKKWCLKAYEKRNQIPLKDRFRTNWNYARYFETPNEEIIYLKQLLDLDDQNPKIHHNLGNSYINLYQYDKAIPEYEKTLEIYKKWGSKPSWIFDYVYLGEAYRKTGQLEKLKKLNKKAEKDFPDDPYFLYQQVLLSLTIGDTVAANRYIEKGIAYLKSVSISDASISAIIASGYAEVGLVDKADKCYSQALSAEPGNPVRLNDLAYFLIDKDRNVNRGMELVEKALELKPQYYPYLHTKGWGLYKQKKYNDALEMLQKSWDLRIQNAVYDHEAFLHLQVAKKAVASQKKD